VVDFSYVPIWTGMVYVAFVVDAYSRRIVGWRAARSMTTALVLDAFEHALFTRAREGVTDRTGLVSHSDAGSQYTSVALTSRLIEEGIDPSVGSVGDALDNAMAETTVGSFKNELIRRQAPGATSTTSSWPPPNGLPGSTPSGHTTSSTTSHPKPSRGCTTLTETTCAKQADSNQQVSGLAGAAQ
jgi:transposase InsO family protein